MKLEEILNMESPQEAHKAIMLNRDLNLLEKLEMILAYCKRHGIEMEEMFYYPNGEEAVTRDMILYPEE